MQFKLFNILIDLHHEAEENVMLYEQLKYKLHHKINHEFPKINLPLLQDFDKLYEKNAINKKSQFETSLIQYQFPKSTYGRAVKNLRKVSLSMDIASSPMKNSFYPKSYSNCLILDSWIL